MAIVKNKPLLDTLRQRGEIKGSALGAAKFQVTFDMKDLAKPETQIFALSPEVALAAEKMVQSPSFKLPDLSQLKFPYPHMAVEVPLTKEIKAFRDKATVNGQYPIKRVGLIIQANNEEGWVNCIPYWEYENPNLCQVPLLSFALGVDFIPAPKVGVHLPNNPSEIAYFKILPAICATNAFEKAGVPPENFARIFKDPLFNTYIQENVSELPMLLFACTLMLNCKTGVKYTKVAAKAPPPGLSLGAKKKKRYSASAYTVLHLEEIENVDADGNITQRADIAAHYVRGHFKQRKHGIYWWNPFVRGKGDPKKREAYIVKSDELAEV